MGIDISIIEKNEDYWGSGFSRQFADFIQLTYENPDRPDGELKQVGDFAGVNLEPINKMMSYHDHDSELEWILSITPSEKEKNEIIEQFKKDNLESWQSPSLILQIVDKLIRWIKRNPNFESKIKYREETKHEWVKPYLNTQEEWNILSDLKLLKSQLEEIIEKDCKEIRFFFG